MVIFFDLVQLEAAALWPISNDTVSVPTLTNSPIMIVCETNGQLHERNGNSSFNKFYQNHNRLKLCLMSSDWECYFSLIVGAMCVVKIIFVVMLGIQDAFQNERPEKPQIIFAILMNCIRYKINKILMWIVCDYIECYTHTHMYI